MTCTLITFISNNPKGFKNNLLTILLIGILFVISVTNASSQTNPNWIQHQALFESILFQTQPSINVAPFNSEKKIIPFNSTKNFDRIHYSELELKVSVFPNPASNHVSVSIPAEGIVSFSSSTGKLIENHKVDEGELILDTSSLPEGIYFVQLFTQGDAYSKRLLIRH